MIKIVTDTVTATAKVTVTVTAQVTFIKTTKLLRKVKAAVIFKLIKS